MSQQKKSLIELF